MLFIIYMLIKEIILVLRNLIYMIKQHILKRMRLLKKYNK